MSQDIIENTKKGLLACMELISAQNDYIKYLARAEAMTMGYLYAHNWRYPDEFIKEGEPLRENIRQANKKFEELHTALGLTDPTP